MLSCICFEADAANLTCTLRLNLILRRHSFDLLVRLDFIDDQT